MNRVKTKIVNITAEYAAELLERQHEHQRRCSERQVSVLARIMSEGNWQSLNGDTIVIDTDGRVIDGQHRLLAVIKSSVVITTLLVEGVAPEAYYSIDLQAKGRSLRDVLEIEGYKNASPLATALRNVWFYKRDMQLKGSQILPAVQDLMGLLDSNEDGFLRAIKECYKLKGILASGQVAFLFYIFAQQSVSDAEAFFKSLSTGVGFRDHDAVRLLRDRLMGEYYSKSKLPTIEKLGLCVVAWNAFRTGKKVRVLRWKRHDGAKLPEVL